MLRGKAYFAKKWIFFHSKTKKIYNLEIYGTITIVKKPI